MQDKPSEPSLGSLISDVGRLMRKRFDQRAKELGLTRAQWQVLAHLARSEGFSQEGISQAALADLMEIEPITLSRHIDRMAEAGWVTRGSHPTDRRVRLISMTDKARGVLDRMRGIGRTITSEALDGLPPETVRHMMDALQHLRVTLSAKSEAPETNESQLRERTAR